MSSIKKSKSPKNRYRLLENGIAILYIFRKGELIETKIDSKYLDIIEHFNWFIMGQTKTRQGYVGFSRKVKGKTIYYKLHRLILEVKDENIFVDHINRDRFDNRECNLRLASRFENSYNSSKNKYAKSKFKGVRKTSSGMFECSIRVSGKNIYLGSFMTELEAVKVYDESAVFYHGEFAATNVSLGLISMEELKKVSINRYYTYKKENVWYSKYRGVSRQINSNKKPWRAYITFNGKHIRIGGFATEEEAAIAYDRKAKDLFGSSARLNFPNRV
jgi:hypothetical protein